MSGVNLWVDDLRTPPDDSWAWAKTSEVAIELLMETAHTPLSFSVMSLDHDLGGDDTTRLVVLSMCENQWMWPREVRVHTANPVGREWLVGMVRRYAPDGVTVP